MLTHGSRSTQCLDSTGAKIKPGLRYQLIQAVGHWPAGSICLVHHIHTREIGVIFETLRSKGHNLDGFAPDGGGWNLLQRETTYLQPVSNPEDIVTLAHNLSSTGAVILFKGHYYTLTPAPLDNEAQLLAPIQAYYQSQLSQRETANQTKINQLQEQLDSIPQLKPIPKSFCQSGGLIWYDSSKLFLAYPIRYAPKYLIKKRCPPHAEISAEHQQQLLQEKVYFVMTLYANWSYGGAYLYQPSLSNKFSHYHQNSTSCLGSNIKSMITEPMSITVFVFIAKAYEKALECVTINDALNGNPTGLPSLDALQRDAKTLTTVTGWSTLSEEDQRLEALRNSIAEGAIVQISLTNQSSSETHISELRSAGFDKAIAKVVQVSSPYFVLQFAKPVPESIRFSSSSSPTNYITYIHQDYVSAVLPAGTSLSVPGQPTAQSTSSEPSTSWTDTGATSGRITSTPFQVGDHVRIAHDNPQFGMGSMAGYWITEVGQILSISTREPHQITVNFAHHPSWSALASDLILTDAQGNQIERRAAQ